MNQNDKPKSKPAKPSKPPLQAIKETFEKKGNKKV